jgi:hypothetical protein
VDLVRTDILKERVTSIFTVEEICELGTTLAVTKRLRETVSGGFVCISDDVSLDAEVWGFDNVNGDGK